MSGQRAGLPSARRLLGRWVLGARLGCLALGAALALASCAAGDAIPNAPVPPEPAELSSLAPSAIVRGSSVWLRGPHFSSAALHFLELDGTVQRGGELSSWSYSVELVPEGQRLRWDVNDALFASLVDGVFEGEARILSRNRWGEARGPAIAVRLSFHELLQPKLSVVTQGLVYLNAAIEVEGAGLLFGGAEGQSHAELEGCFLPEAQAGADCAQEGVAVHTVVSLVPQDTSRARASFAFGPGVAGIAPGRFSGKVWLVNQQPSAAPQKSEALELALTLRPSRIVSVTPEEISLGQFIDIRGDGFVGGAEGVTLVRFEGRFVPEGGSERPLAVELVAHYLNGGHLRYVWEQGNGLGELINARVERGRLDGRWTPVLRWHAEERMGEGAAVVLTLAPLRQVVWVRFQEEWLASLTRFGLQAGDAVIRQRIIAVLERDYAGVNVSFRFEQPKDVALYAIIDIGGADPNGLGLLGYDNTPGKDVGNLRLADRIGGVNALTQEDGFPGYGGVFADSQLAFSQHPPQGVLRSPLADGLFDTIFDSTRLDRGQPATAREVAEVAGRGAPPEHCPGSSRGEQVDCALWVLGNLVGHTASHELGHSFGLADPNGPPAAFHNPGDLPNRMMEGGEGRPFAERAQLNGQGPAVFCRAEYEYLRRLMPGDAVDPFVGRRPSCD